MTRSDTRTIGFIGAGNMTQSIIGGMMKAGYPPQSVSVSNPSRTKLDRLEQTFGIHTSLHNREIAEKSDVIVLSVKPQRMHEVCTELATHLVDLDKKLFVTIAAGLRIARYQEFFGPSIKLIRCMPNTPSLVGTGMSGLLANEQTTRSDAAFVQQIFDYVGQTIWLEDENAMDVFAAIAGSGPAYFFEFMLGLQSAAEKLGFATEQARAIVQQTALGAAHMTCENELSLSELRNQVTSKGGSTAKGIEVFQAAELKATTTQAVEAAVARNQEMAKLF